MKNFFKTLNFLVLIVSLANCAKSEFDTAAGYNNNNNVMEGSDEVTYADPHKDNIIWSKAANNIYIVISGKCVKGLASNADDPIIEEKLRQLSELINQSRESGSNNYDMATLEIRYEDDSHRTFDVDLNQSGKGLSNSREIREFFENIRSEINRNGVISCRNAGK